MHYTVPAILVALLLYLCYLDSITETAAAAGDWRLETGDPNDKKGFDRNLLKCFKRGQ